MQIRLPLHSGASQWEWKRNLRAVILAMGRLRLRRKGNEENTMRRIIVVVDESAIVTIHIVHVLASGGSEFPDADPGRRGCFGRRLFTSAFRLPGSLIPRRARGADSLATSLAFPPELVSRHETVGELPTISKTLKMRRLRRSFFGTRPALNNPGGKQRDRANNEASTGAANLGVKPPR